VNRPRVVYADPPYSAAQYSRYYHVLETLVLYDYPESSGAGRYRGDRHQTAFSKLGSVEGAFRDVIRSVAAMDAALVLSYPSNGLLYEVGADPVQLLQDHYKVIEVLSTGTARHSTLGGAPGRAKSCVEEVIYVAKEPA
jgi:adenine-specific DNA-methyltransferase